MNKETIRRIDALLGQSLCWLLTLHRRLREARGKNPASGPPRRILFIKLIEQGATVIAYDAIRLAVERMGRENVFFCVFTENRGILDIMELIPSENVFALRSGRFSQFALDALRVVRAVRAAGIDTTVDMEFFARGSAILAYLTGAARRVGLHRFTDEGPYRGDLMTHRVTHNPFLHVGRSYRLLVEAIDADPADVPLVKIPARAEETSLPLFAPHEAERHRVMALIDEVAALRPRGPLVLLNPNPGDQLPLRKWPAERFIELGQRLLDDRPDMSVLVTGTPDEREAADDLCRRIGSARANSLAGRVTFRELMVLYTLADLLVTNDSGPGHFSSLTLIQSIVLFGPGSWQQYGPLGRHSRALSADLACSPCLHALNHRVSPCTNNRCMQAISVDEVLAAVHARLPSKAATGAANAG